MINPPSMPRLLLHTCCAPCATVAISRLREKYKLSIFFFGPNIHPFGEYAWRLEELKRLCQNIGLEIIEGQYSPAEWGLAISPYRTLPEGSLRCEACYRLRMLECAKVAKQRDFDMFTVTLTTSRYKNSNLIKTIGLQVSEQVDIAYLVEDFGKKNGYQQSIEWSRTYGLRRQNYCGCSLSRAESLARREAKSPIQALTGKTMRYQSDPTGSKKTFP